MSPAQAPLLYGAETLTGQWNPGISDAAAATGSTSASARTGLSPSGSSDGSQLKCPITSIFGGRCSLAAANQPLRLTGGHGRSAPPTHPPAGPRGLSQFQHIERGLQ